ncbi:hypothetical protein [Candidatus Palauibacter sp.]|uniref:hypothetical protein n=1 Tax=Candidatus Palauibacter sp. TaxID=3101350 RepID=UPI003B02086C
MDKLIELISGGTVLAAIIGGVILLIQQRQITKLQLELQKGEARQKLLELRRPLYRELLEPWTVGLTAAMNSEDPTRAITDQVDSPEYLATLFEFAATASDDLVRSYNEMAMAGWVASKVPQAVDPKKIPEKLGQFLLLVRKDLGLPDTELGHEDMLRVRLPYMGAPDLPDVFRTTPPAEVER